MKKIFILGFLFFSLSTFVKSAQANPIICQQGDIKVEIYLDLLESFPAQTPIIVSVSGQKKFAFTATRQTRLSEENPEQFEASFHWEGGKKFVIVSAPAADSKLQVEQADGFAHFINNEKLPNEIFHCTQINRNDIEIFF